MTDAQLLRELLVAELCLRQGRAAAGAIAEALAGCWGTAWTPGIATLLERAPGSGTGGLADVVAEADRLIAEQGGSTGRALGGAGGLDQSIRAELSRTAAPLSRRIAELKVPTRFDLPTLRPGRYLHFAEVGRGGQGVVYSAFDTELNRPVAIKLLQPEQGIPGAEGVTPPAPTGPEVAALDAIAAARIEETRGRFLQEACVTGGLHHPGIVPVYELGQTPEGRPYYTMRFLDAHHTLEQALRENDKKPVGERLALLEPYLRLCDVLAFAHAQGVVHRDIKPDNVFLGAYGEVLLIDWGIASLQAEDPGDVLEWRRRTAWLRAGDPHRTATGVLGTPGYLSPEAAAQRIGEIDQRSDVFSLGVILYRILTGVLPYPGVTTLELLESVAQREPPDPLARDVGVPEPLARICMGALRIDRAKRTGSVDDLSRQIRTWQSADAQQRARDRLLAHATVALDAAEGLEPGGALQVLDRAAALLEQVDAADRGAEAARERLARLRDQASRGELRLARRKHLRMLGVVGVLLVALGATAWGLERSSAERRLRVSEGRARKLAADLAWAGAAVAQAKGRYDDFVPAMLDAFELQDRTPAREILFAETLAARPARLGTPNPAVGVAFAPDGLHVIVYGAGADPVIYDCATVTPRRALSAGGLDIRQLEYEAGGLRVLAGAADGTLRLWDAVAGTVMHTWTGHAAAVRRIAVHPKGGRAATASEDGRLVVWDLAASPPTQLHAWEFPDLQGGTVRLSVDVGWSRMAVWRRGSVVHIVDPEQGSVVRVIGPMPPAIWGGAVSPDGRLFASAGEDRRVRLWNLEGEAQPPLIVNLSEGDPGQPRWLHVVSFDASGKQLFVGGLDPVGYVLALGNPQQPVVLRLAGQGAILTGGQWSRAGDTLLTSALDGSAILWDARTGLPLVTRRTGRPSDRPARMDALAQWAATIDMAGAARLLPLGRPPAWEVAGRCTPQSLDVGRGRLWVSGSEGLRAVDAASGQTVAEASLLPVESGETYAVLPPNGAWLARVAGRSVSFHDPVTGKREFVSPAQETPITGLAVDPTGRQLATGSDDGQVLIWDPRTPASPAKLGGAAGGVTCIAFSPSGETLLRANWGGHVALERLGAARQTLELRGHTQRVNSAAFDRSGARIVTASNDGTLRLWEVATGRVLSVFEGHSASVDAVAFGPDDQRILSGSSDGTLRVWSLESGRTLRTLERHVEWIWSVGFGTDPDVLISAGQDRTARLWEEASGLQLASLRHPDSVEAAFPGPDGTTLITSCHDGRTRAWAFPRERRPVSELKALLEAESPSR